jgi:hypothetical protein
MFTQQRKKKNSSVIPGSRAIPQSAQIPVLSDENQSLLANFTLVGAALAAGFVLLGVGLILVANRPVPDLVIMGQDTYKVQPLKKTKLSEPDQVVLFLEKRFPALYTWVGLIPDRRDPTGTTFIRDEGKAIETEKGAIKIPSSVYAEQFILAEPIRIPTMQSIAELIEKTGTKIWQTDPNNPSVGTTYRFVFRGRPQFPEEVEPGRWKVTIQGDIIKLSPTVLGAPQRTQLQTIAMEVYVRRAGRNLPIQTAGEAVGPDWQDFVSYGKKDGFEIDALIPYDPKNDPLPKPE